MGRTASVITPSGHVRISFDQLLAGTYWKYRRNPVLVVSTMLQTSLQVMGQTVIPLRALVLLFQLLKTEFLQNLVDAIINGLYDQIPPHLESPQLRDP